MFLVCELNSLHHEYEPCVALICNNSASPEMTFEYMKNLQILTSRCRVLGTDNVRIKLQIGTCKNQCPRLKCVEMLQGGIHYEVILTTQFGTVA